VVVGYDVLRDGASIGQATDTTFTDTVPVSQSQHTYVVESVSAQGVHSGPSNEAVVSTGDTVAPSVPTGVAASANGPNSATVTWAASSDAVGVSEYRISRDGAQVGVVDGGSTSWTENALLSQTTYTYTVSAADAAGNVSAPSDPASVTTPEQAGQAAVADTYANSASPDSVYGTATALRLDGDPQRRPYIMLPVGTGTGTIARARLRVYLQSKLLAGFSVSAVPSTWLEKKLTWNNAPPPGPLVVSAGPVAAAGWVEVDVTSLAAGLAPGETLSVALVSTSGTSVSVSSRETTNKPNLLVDWSG
jgi:chitodextrinase